MPCMTCNSLFLSFTGVAGEAVDDSHSPIDGGREAGAQEPPSPTGSARITTQPGTEGESIAALL